MLIIPALDIKGEKCVQLVGGVFGSERIVIEDIESVINKFCESGTKRIHIVDLDAAKKRGDNYNIIKNLIRRKKCEIEIGGGIRNVEKVKEIITDGADFVIVGTAAIKNFSFLKNIADEIGKDKIIVSLDYRNKKVVTDGWENAIEMSPIEIGKQLQDNCTAFLMTCVDVEGKMLGPDIEYLKKIVKELDIPIIASGGISSVEDIKKLKEIGVYGVVIGMALYMGKIDLIEAIKYEN